MKTKLDKSKFDIKTTELVIDGVTFTVPFIPATEYTKSDGVVKVVEPAWVTAIRYIAQGKGGVKAIETAGLAMARAIALAINQAIGLKLDVLSGPIAVSEACPEDTILWDARSGRIIMNEELGARTARDADGDQVALVIEGDLCIAIKNPILMGLTVYKFGRITQDELLEYFEPLTMDFAKQMLENSPKSAVDWSSQFAKGHRVAQIGIGTNAHATADLFATRHLSFEERIHQLANRDWVTDSVTGATVTRRFHDLETKGLQANRREANESKEIQITRFPWQVQSPWNVLTVNANSVVRQPPTALMTIAQADLTSLVENAMKLNFGFSKKTFKAVEKPKIYRQVWYDDLWQRLVNLGLITYQVLERPVPLFDKNGNPVPPPILVKFVSPSGEVCGLTDVKRQDDANDALTYGFVVYPGHTEEAFKHSVTGEKFRPKEMGRILSPQELLSHWLGTIDNTILNPELGIVTGYFPRNVAQWVEPKFATKVAIIQEQILKIIAKRGDAVPLDTQGRMLRIGYETAINTICVHYGTECEDWHEVQTTAGKQEVVTIEGWTIMEVVAKEVEEILSINWFSTKSDSKSFRKYVISSPKGADERRAGRQRSQLLRAILKTRMRVAFVLGDTKSGVLITPSGVEKQRIKDNRVFYPIVFNTWEDYTTHLRSHNLDEEQYPVVERTFSTWIGEKRTVWVAEPKACIRIGKLVDELGNKFMPRACSQFVDGDGSEIDLIFPVTELFAKRCAHLFLDQVQETTIYGYADIKCLVGEFTFYRTGSASENSRPGKKVRNVRGMDIFTVLAGLQNLDTAYIEPQLRTLLVGDKKRKSAKAALRSFEVNLAYAKELQELYIQFWKFFGDLWIQAAKREDEGLDGAD